LIALGSLLSLSGSTNRGHTRRTWTVPVVHFQRNQIYIHDPDLRLGTNESFVRYIEQRLLLNDQSDSRVRWVNHRRWRKFTDGIGLVSHADRSERQQERTALCTLLVIQMGRNLSRVSPGLTNMPGDGEIVAEAPLVYDPQHTSCKVLTCYEPPRSFGSHAKSRSGRLQIPNLSRRLGSERWC
jgi:hypothetical protein